MEQSSLLQESLPMIILPFHKIINQFLEEPYPHIKGYLSRTIGRPETIDDDAHFVYIELLPRQEYWEKYWQKYCFTSEETVDELENNDYRVITDTLSKVSKLPLWAEQYVGKDYELRYDMKSAAIGDYEHLESLMMEDDS